MKLIKERKAFRAGTIGKMIKNDEKWWKMMKNDENFSMQYSCLNLHT